MALYSNVTATYSAAAIVDLVGADVEMAGERITHSSDTDAFLTFQAFVKKDRSVTLHTHDASDALGLTQGAAAASLVVVLKTADGGSDLTLTVSSVVGNISGSVAHASVDNDFSIPFHAVSSDGTTDPLGVA